MVSIIGQFVRLVVVSVAMAGMMEPPPVSRPLQFEGSLSRYDPGVMSRVLEWRHRNGIPAGFDPWPIGREPYDGYIAVIGCEHVGKTAVMWVTIDGVRQEQPKQVYVADCTTPDAPAADWMRDYQIAAELDYAAWQAWGVVDGRGAWVEVTILE